MSKYCAYLSKKPEHDLQNVDVDSKYSPTNRKVESIDDHFKHLLKDDTLKKVLNSLDSVQKDSGLEEAYRKTDQPVYFAPVENDLHYDKPLDANYKVEYSDNIDDKVNFIGRTSTHIAQDREREIYENAVSIQTEAKEHHLRGKIYMDVGWKLRDARNAVFCMSPAMWTFIYENLGKISFPGLDL